MKKTIRISLVALFAAVPMMAMAAPVGTGTTPTSIAAVNQPADHAAAVTAGVVASGNPYFELAEANSQTDDNAASAGYVKGAYNATIKAVNTLNSIKQDKLNSGNGGNISESGSGPVVTGVSAANGVVTVAKGQVTIPYGSASSSTQATIWIQ